MTNCPDYICQFCSRPVKPGKTHWCPSWETGEKMRRERETVVSDPEARLLAWMRPCAAGCLNGRIVVSERIGPSDWEQYEDACEVCRGSGQVPVLLGVTVQVCAENPATHDDWCVMCGLSGYVWQRQDAVERLLEWIGGTTTFARSADGWQVLWSRERRPHATWDATPYEALLKAVDVLREIKSKS